MFHCVFLVLILVLFVLRFTSPFYLVDLTWSTQLQAVQLLNSNFVSMNGHIYPKIKEKNARKELMRLFQI